MKNHSNLQEIEQDVWPLKKKFLNIVEPYRSDLWKYCRYLTRSPWDAEDLVQETLMKAFASLGQIWQSLTPKTYLFRIATNTWINEQRRKQLKLDEFIEEKAVTNTESSKFNVTESIETLVQQLPLRQVVAVLLIDVFDFTAKEAAEMMTTTEGAVKATLHRARTTLKSSSLKGESKMMNKEDLHRFKRVNPNTIQAFVKAFNDRNPDAMAALLDEQANHDIIHVGQEYGREVIRKYSIADEFNDPTIHLQHAELRELWGCQVMAVFIKQPELQLHDIIYIEAEQDKVVYFRHYYFCQDFLQEAAKEFNITVQSDKQYKIL